MSEIANILIWYIVLGFWITNIIIRPILLFLIQVNCIEKNHADKNIPVGGIIFIFGFFISSLLVHLINEPSQEFLYLFIGIVSAGFLGLLDDIWGNAESKGLKGHFKQLMNGRLTTGGLKAVGGGFLAIFLALPFSTTIGHLVLNSGIIALSINFINLLDLRPGRAIKVFLVGIGIVFIIGIKDPTLGLLVGVVLAYFPYDLKERVMMGDAGSNILGLALGISFVWVLSIEGKLIYLFLLVIIHLYAEYYSITKFIEKSSYLKAIDRLGRS